MFGYAIADSVETTAHHQMNLLALAGKQFNNKLFYLGLGPSLINLKSQNYNSIGYATIDGEVIDVTGLVNYQSPNIWAWGGAAQIGMSYYLDANWFVDVSYTYSLAATYSSPHEQSFTNTTTLANNPVTTYGILTTKDTLKSTTLQSIHLSINRRFDY